MSSHFGFDDGLNGLFVRCRARTALARLRQRPRNRFEHQQRQIPAPRRLPALQAVDDPRSDTADHALSFTGMKLSARRCPGADGVR